VRVRLGMCEHSPNTRVALRCSLSAQSKPANEPLSQVKVGEPRCHEGIARERRIDRYYDPVTGEFLTMDPQSAQTGEPYAYAGGDPVNESDPTGQDTLGVCGAISGSALGAAGFVSGCLDRTVGTPNDDIGFVGTVGVGGSAGYGAFGSVFVQVSNADSLDDLRGPFAWFGITIGGGTYGAQAIAFVGNGANNRSIFGIELGAGRAVNVSGVSSSPFIISGGFETTGVHIVRQWWLADPLRLLWDVLTPGVNVAEVLSFARSIINRV